MGLGAAVTNPKIVDAAVEELRAITGQKPVVTALEKPSRASSSARASHRRHGHPAPRQHVGVPRPPGHHRASAYA